MPSKRVTTREAEMRWLEDNKRFLEQNHAGKWLALQGYNLVAIGDSLDEVLDEAQRQQVMNPLVTAVKRKEYQGVILIRDVREPRI